MKKNSNILMPILISIAFSLCTIINIQAQKKVVPKLYQNENVLAYIATYKEIAMDEMVRTGVPAAITLAQGILESHFGQSKLCKISNNHFGIKCKPEWTGGKTYHNDDRRGECFRVYSTAAESFRDHSDFLKNRPYYTELFLLDPIDYHSWAYGLKKAGYAVEKQYPKDLIRLIDVYNLNQYSLLVLNKIADSTNIVKQNAVQASIKEKIDTSF